MTSEILDIARNWLDDGRRVALATVVGTWGSSPCPAGSKLVVSGDGQFAGSVSGGCVESAVIETAQKVITSGTPELLEFGVTDERAWEVGLACGGTVRIHVQALAGATGMPRDFLERILAAQAAGRPMALLTRLPGGAQRLLDLDAPAGWGVSEAESAAVHAAEQADRCSVFASPAGDIFIQVFNPPPRVIVVGAVHIGQHLAVQAQACGYGVTIVDPRTSFAAAERFPDITLRTDWPDQAMAALRPDRRTAVVALSHDPKLDDPALAAALRSEAFYIGALGSRKNQTARLGRLREQGFADSDLGRIHGPVGLNINASSPAEIAVSIMAEIIKTLRG